MKLKPKEDANALTDSEDDTLPIVQWVSEPSSSEPPSNSWSFNKITDQEVDTPAIVPKGQPTISIGNQILLANYHKTQDLLKDERGRVVKLQTDIETQTAKITKAQEDFETQKTRGYYLRAEIERLQRDHAIELRKVHQNRSEEVNQAMNKALGKVEATQREKDLKSLNESAHLCTELLQVRKERDELRRSLAPEKMRSVSGETERQMVSTLTTKLNFLQAETATLRTDLEKEKKEHTRAKHDLDAQAHLAHELASHKESLKRDVDKRSTCSPTPAASSAEETKVENVRKTYIRVKMRYDILYSIAKDLHISTNGMNLTSFGEFGGYLKQLRTAMEEVDQEGGGDVQRSKDPGYAESTASIP
jgi:hypothetical protein